VDKSQHIRTSLFFLVLNQLRSIQFKNISFEKLSLQTFKGTVHSLHYISQNKFKPVKKKKLYQDNILCPTEENKKLNYYDAVIRYEKILKETINNYKFYINTVVHTNVYNFIKKNVISIVHKTSFLKIT